MTEREWMACTDSQQMLGFLQGRVSERKLRLFAVACCRRIEKDVSSEQIKATIDLCDQLGESLITGDDLRRVSAVFSGALSFADATVSYLLEHCRSASEPPLGDVSGVCTTARFAAYVCESRFAAGAAELSFQSDVVRCVFGPLPFRSVILHLNWLTVPIRKLAECIYDDRAFNRLPILADALEEAGCTDRAILDHCRQPGEHVRGCWVVDLILGKQ